MSPTKTTFPPSTGSVVPPIQTRRILPVFRIRCWVWKQGMDQNLWQMIRFCRAWVKFYFSSIHSCSQFLVAYGCKGDRLPSCPGGPNELATIILGDGLYETAQSLEMKLLQGVQAVLETPPPPSFTILHLCLALLHFSGSTTKASLSEGTLISLVPRIGFVWEWNCQEGFVKTSRFLSLKRLSLELTSVSLGAPTRGEKNIQCFPRHFF